MLATKFEANWDTAFKIRSTSFVGEDRRKEGKKKGRKRGKEKDWQV